MTTSGGAAAPPDVQPVATVGASLHSDHLGAGTLVGGVRLVTNGWPHLGLSAASVARWGATNGGAVLTRSSLMIDR